MVYEGRMQAKIMAKNQNEALRRLIIILLYSYGISLQVINDPNFIENLNSLSSAEFMAARGNDHISGLLLRIFCNINDIYRNEQDQSPEPNQEIDKMLDSCLSLLNKNNASVKIEDYRSSERLFLV